MKFLFAASLTLMFAAILFGLLWLKTKIQINKMNLNNNQKKEFFTLLKSKGHVRQSIYNIILMGMASAFMIVVMAYNGVDHLSLLLLIFAFVGGFFSSALHWMNYSNLSNFKKTLSKQR